MNSRNLIYIGLGLLAAAPLCAQDAPAPTPAPVAVAAQAPAPELNQNDDAAFKAIGYMVVQRMKLNVGFSDEQNAWILEGAKAALAGGEAPETFPADIRRAEMLFKDRVAKMMEENKALAVENEKLGQAYIDALPDKDKLTKTESGLYYTILVPGDEAKKADKFDRVKVNYVGSFIDGKEFDKSPEAVELSVTGVVPGMTEGLQLVGEGGKIRLYIPGNLGYAANPPAGSNIKPGAMLIFDVEVVSVIPGRKPPAFDPTKMKAPGNPPNMTPPPPPAGGFKTPPAPPTTTPPPLPPEVLKNRPTQPPTTVPPSAVVEKTAEADKAAAEEATK